MSQEKIIVVYRKSHPYPIRHWVAYRNYQGEDEFWQWYHERFWAFEDDCLTVCEDSAEAAAFIEKLRIEEYKRLQPPQL